MTTKRKIEYGSVEVDDEDLAPSNVRRRISIMIPEDVIAKLTAMGARQSVGYQTVINRLLREAVSGDERDATASAYQAIKAGLKRLEKLIVEQRAPGKPKAAERRAAPAPRRGKRA